MNSTLSPSVETTNENNASASANNESKPTIIQELKRKFNKTNLHIKNYVVPKILSVPNPIMRLR